MKYLFLCLLVLGLIGCGSSHGPDTGWACPDCDWGVSQSAKACPNCGADLERFSGNRKGGPAAGERPELPPVDPTLTNLDPRQFIIDLDRTIRGFNGLLESIKDEEAFVVTEMALIDLAEKMEDLGDQSMGLTAEPKEEDREELSRMIGELQEQVVRLETLGDQKRDNRELWKRIDSLYNRFDAAMRMIPMIPPAGYRDPATP